MSDLINMTNEKILNRANQMINKEAEKVAEINRYKTITGEEAPDVGLEELKKLNAVIEPLVIFRKEKGEAKEIAYDLLESGTTLQEIREIINFCNCKI